MATYDYIVPLTTKYFGVGIPGHKHPVFTIKRRITIADLCTTLGVSALTATNCVSIIDIPDNTLVIGVLTKIITACTTSGAQTVNVGDYTGITSTAGWANATSLKATAGTYVWSQTYNTNDYPKRYVHATDPTINLYFNTAPANGVFDVTVLCADLNGGI